MAVFRFLRLATVGAAMLLCAGPAFAQASDKAEIEKIIREYLLNNPEIIQEALVALEQKRRKEEESARADTIAKRSDVLFDSVHQSELGNLGGDVTLVEFFDYNCGFCKRALGDMMRLIEEDKNLRIVMKEFPVLGEGSVEAARVSIAVQRLAPDKFLDFHATLLATRGQANKDAAMRVVEQIGLDPAAVEKELAEGDINIPIEEAYGLANGLGLTGTPSYVVGSEVVMGAVGYDALREKIESWRKCGQATC